MINKSKKEKGQLDNGMQIWNIAGDLSLEMHMIQIPFFIESSKNSILLQPSVIFGPLSISFLKDPVFFSKMQSPNNDFNEEMHILVYQVATKEDIDELELNNNEYTNVFSSYTTEANQSAIHPCEDSFAIYPKMDGLGQFVHSMKINHEVVNNPVQEIQEIFKAMNFDNWIHEDILYGKRPLGEVEPNNATQIQKKIISERKAFL
jgi:hypothetical protein